MDTYTFMTGVNQGGEKPARRAIDPSYTNKAKDINIHYDRLDDAIEVEILSDYSIEPR